MNPYVDDLVLALRATPPLAARSAQAEASELECPVCHTRMVVERKHGVAVDVCPTHGVWFDLGELPALVNRVRLGAKVGIAAAIADAKTQGKISEALFGLWSFLFD